jgi:hypothetical protein
MLPVTAESDGATSPRAADHGVTRSGVVTAVEDRLITVRWDAGSESVFVPSAGSLQVTDHESAAGEPDSS